MPENPIQNLDYAPRPRLWRRRSFRLTLLAIFVLILAAAGVYWYPDISFRIRLAYWQHQCMTHVIPPDKVILTADPKLVAGLLNDPDYVPTSARYVPGILAAYRPRCYRKYQNVCRTINDVGDDAVIFMHKLTSQRGIERLVVAFGRGENYAKFVPQHGITIEVLRPLRLSHRPNAPGYGLETRTQFNLSRRLSSDPPRIQLHPGQLDPADPSHFTVRWEATGAAYEGTTHGVFDFRLSPDGTSVMRTDTIGIPPGK